MTDLISDIAKEVTSLKSESTSSDQLKSKSSSNGKPETTKGSSSKRTSLKQRGKMLRVVDHLHFPVVRTLLLI